MRGEMVARWLDEKKEIVIVAPFPSFALWENALVRIALVLCDAELCVTYGVRKQSTLSRGWVGSEYLKVRKKEWQGDPRVKNAL